MREEYKMETKIKYNKNGSVTLNMSLKEYEELLKGYNNLRSVTQTLHECHDLFMSDLRKLEFLEVNLFDNLGFVRPKEKDGRENYYAQAVLSNDSVLVKRKTNEKG